MSRVPVAVDARSDGCEFLWFDVIAIDFSLVSPCFELFVLGWRSRGMAVVVVDSFASVEEMRARLKS